MDFNKFVTVAISLLFVAEGIVALTKGTMRGDFSKYTEESIKKYAKVYGIFLVIGGVLFIGGFVFSLLSDTVGINIVLARWICYLGGLAVIIVALCLRPAFLKKK